MTSVDFASMFHMLFVWKIYIYVYICSLVTLHTFVFTQITSVVGPGHFFIARNRVSKSRLKAELCFHRYIHFACVLIYI